MVKKEILFFSTYRPSVLGDGMFYVCMEGFQNFRQCLKKKGQKTILLLKRLLCINEKKLLCQIGSWWSQLRQVTWGQQASDNLLCHFLVLQFVLWLLVLCNIGQVCSSGQLEEFCERFASSYTKIVHAVSKTSLQVCQKLHSHLDHHFI